MTRIVISSGHGKYIRGASGILDEVNEARKVVERLATELRGRDVTVTTYHDDVSTTQSENLNRIVDFHNAQTRDLDVSVHFNAYVETEKPMGTECLYITQVALADMVSSAIAGCGFIDRGAKKRTDLFFLNNTEMPAILIEVCFVDSAADADVYGTQFGEICDAIADVLGGEGDPITAPDVGLDVTGSVSWFGGPDDEGVSPGEGLAFISEIEQQPELFLPYQPDGTSGLARRLNPHIHYVACRWDYDETPREQLLAEMALVRNTRTGMALTAFPADWGPNENTGRVADISPGLMDDLDLTTDDEVEVTFPYREKGVA
jgi:N-acetylmuramoyl-L-alanine amidase